ncbi:hypothetical protein BDQ17DRAFT_1414627 [Cyathus striatus]|nr:hypothetical protein BDQ17DRAFT_1414627 [Cyathus striatus]
MPSTECLLCLSEYMEAVSLPCGHVYCSRCIRDFVNSIYHEEASRCPTCQAQFSIVKPDLTLLPNQYHKYVLPAIRRVYPTLLALGPPTVELEEAQRFSRNLSLKINESEKLIEEKRTIIEHVKAKCLEMDNTLKEKTAEFKFEMEKIENELAHNLRNNSTSLVDPRYIHIILGIATLNSTLRTDLSFKNHSRPENTALFYMTVFALLSVACYIVSSVLSQKEENSNYSPKKFTFTRRTLRISLVYSLASKLTLCLWIVSGIAFVTYPFVDSPRVKLIGKTLLYSVDFTLFYHYLWTRAFFFSLVVEAMDIVFKFLCRE